MSTKWIYRLHIFIPENDKATANALWTLIAPEGNEEAQTYGVPLSSTGEEPITYRGASGAFTAEMLALLKISQDDMSIVYYVCDAWTFELLEQYGGSATIGNVLSWQQALEDRGLQVIEPEIL